MKQKSLFFLAYALLCIQPVIDAKQQPSASAMLPHRQEMFSQCPHMFSRELESGGEYMVIDRFVKPGQVVFDVGANVGTWSYYALKCATDIELYAFEPTPKPFGLLQNNLRSWKGVQTFPLALSNKDGTCKFICYERDLLNSFFLREKHGKWPAYPGKKEAIQVETMTLDTFCAKYNIKTIDFLKLDTEGAEHLIFLGARNLLKQQRIRTIQFEYNLCYKLSKTTLQAVYQLLMSNGYSVYLIGHNTITPIPRWNPALENYHQRNLLALANRPPSFK